MEINKKGKFLLGLSSVAVGFLLVVLIKSNANVPAAGAEASYQNLLKLEQENQQLAADNEKIREEIAKFNSDKDATEVANEQLEKGKISAGLVGMSGPGIRVTLDDSKRIPEANENVNVYLIHEQYIREIVNYLWNGEAEAIAINGQRITATSEIYCNGSNISINGVAKYPPFIIEAIGNQDNLNSALKFWTWDLLASYQTDYGITRKTELVNKINIGAGTPKTYQYAEPVKEGT